MTASLDLALNAAINEELENNDLRSELAENLNDAIEEILTSNNSRRLLTHQDFIKQNMNFTLLEEYLL